jgi:hypothetical protein
VAEGEQPTDLTTRVRAWLRQQGFALEYETARGFRAAGFRAQQGLTYRDRETGKTREIDVVAELPPQQLRPPTGWPRFRVVVECKSSAQPWIVRKTTLDDEQKRWRPIATKLVVNYLANHQTLDRFLVGDPTGIEADAMRNKNGDQNGAHDALAQVVSATLGLLSEHDPVYLHPVVVLDGQLFSLWYGDDGIEDLRPSLLERVLWSGGSHSSRPVLIDVVTRDGLAACCSRLKAELEGIERSLPQRSFVAPTAVGF